MSDVLSRLNAALAGRYAVERELGGGGMATVYLARDLRYPRSVAIKVLRPELAAALGGDRFQREIDVAASLSHPNILPLYDSGDAGGLLWYAMPYVEGESLADRMQRETQLAIEEAVRIGGEVADALAYAHSRGIVHRDIKPANILLSGAHALVADFGIARAVGGADTHRLTSTGMAIGTPTYMSPEQSAGSTQLDGRSDIYSLGCVVYEMLIGEPPFTGPTAQMILARHTLERVPSMRAVRDTIPETVEWAVDKALAKTPADRFATADQFAQALAATALPAGVTRPVRAAARRRRLAITLPILAVAAAAAVFAASRFQVRRVPARAPDAGLVAVLPFAAGASNGAAQAAADALAGLVAARLPGEGGLRAVDLGTVGAAVRRVAPGPGSDLAQGDAVRIAELAGAQRMIMGRVASTGARLAVGATLLAVPGGATLARVDTVVGRGDDLPALADGIVSGLLLQVSGEPRERFAVLAAAPLDALRAYLAGRLALAHGGYAQAVRSFKEALARDSTMAPAALGLATAGQILGTGDEDSGKELAWAARHRLGRNDSLYLRALVGPRYPLETSHAARLAAWDSAAAAMPDRIEVWFQLGEQLFHSGGLLGLPDTRERAAAAFRRAVDIDPDFTPALGHLVDLAASAGDSSAIPLAARYLALDTNGEVADFYRWRIAVMRGDQRFLSRFRARLDSVPLVTLDRIISVAQLDGVAMDDALRAAEALRRRSGMRQENEWAVLKLQEVALNAGRPGDAAATARQFRAAAPAQSFQRLIGVVQGLYWGADSAESAALAAQSTRVLTAARGTPEPGRSEDDACAAGLWHVRHGGLELADRAAARLRLVRNALGNVDTGHLALCAAMLEAEAGAARRSGTAAARLRTLDSLMQTGPRAKTWLLAAANLTVAQLEEQAGNLPAALTATRRRYYTFNPGRVLVALSTFLREEGRLSALNGDRAGAVRAYRGYLQLRPDAEPVNAAEVARVRADLARLEAAR